MRLLGECHRSASGIGLSPDLFILDELGAVTHLELGYQIVDMPLRFDDLGTVLLHSRLIEGDAGLLRHLTDHMRLLTGQRICRRLIHQFPVAAPPADATLDALRTDQFKRHPHTGENLIGAQSAHVPVHAVDLEFMGVGDPFACHMGDRRQRFEVADLFQREFDVGHTPSFLT